MRKSVTADFFALFFCKTGVCCGKKERPKIPQKSAEGIAKGRVNFKKGTV